jgi:hypothetical protein
MKYVYIHVHCALLIYLQDILISRDKAVKDALEFIIALTEFYSTLCKTLLLRFYDTSKNIQSEVNKLCTITLKCEDEVIKQRTPAPMYIL